MKGHRDPNALSAIFHRGAGYMAHRCKERGGAKNFSREMAEQAADEREALAEPTGPTSLTDLAYQMECEAMDAEWKRDLDHEAAVRHGEVYYDMKKGPCQCHSCSFNDCDPDESFYDEGD